MADPRVDPRAESWVDPLLVSRIQKVKKASVAKRQPFVHHWLRAILLWSHSVGLFYLSVILQRSRAVVCVTTHHYQLPIEKFKLVFWVSNKYSVHDRLKGYIIFRARDWPLCWRIEMNGVLLNPTNSSLISAV